jgi:integrase
MEIAITDKKLFEIEVTPKKGVGRPRKNREEIAAAIKDGKNTRWIKRHLGPISDSTLGRIRRELKLGQIIPVKTDLEKLGDEAIDFNEATKRAMNTKEGFHEFLRARIKEANRIFRFCEKTWLKLGSPSPSLIADRNSNKAADFASDIVGLFIGDNSSEYIRQIRTRKKYIRYLFRFLGRDDINNRYLTMTLSRDPEQIREVPAINLTNFPPKLEAAIKDTALYFYNRYGTLAGIEAELILDGKIVWKIRTGNLNDERELFGIKRGMGETSLVMNSPNEMIFKTKAKLRERWDITWTPTKVRELLWEIYNTRKDGEAIFQLNLNEFRRVFKENCVKNGLPPLTLHDLRRVSITWLYIMGVPLEVAIELNVGWTDFNTVKKHYIRLRNLLKNDVKAEYRKNIPAWYKDGLDQYIEGNETLLDRIKELEVKLASLHP